MTSSSWTGISESAKNLVSRMLTLDPQERITVTEVSRRGDKYKFKLLVLEELTFPQLGI